MKIFAHRGDSWFYPENTILAFKKALSLPIYCIELDIHKSKDNQLVVIHDETVNTPLSALKMIKYNVDGVFTDFPNLIYNILIKTIDIFHS